MTGDRAVAAGASGGASAARILAALEAGIRVVDLAQPLLAEAPSSPSRPGFQMSLTVRHGDLSTPSGTSFSQETIVTGGHIGTHLDALSHVSSHGLLHGGVVAEDAQRGGRFARHGIEEIGPFVGRGVLLDVAGLHGVDALPGGYAVTKADLEGAAKRAGVVLQAGDAALVRTGWPRHWHDRDAFVGLATGVPGPDTLAARWLAEIGVALTGSDTIAYEQVPPGGIREIPVHVLLLVEAGIPIAELLDLETLAADGVGAFALVLAPLRIVGATGAPVRPLALLDT